MQHILTIDLDYALCDCIELYNDLVRTYMPKDKLWAEIEARRHVAKYVEIDEKRFSLLKKLVTKHKQVVTVVYRHDSVLRYLPTGEQFTLVNVDHHHDLFYGEESKDAVMKFDYVSEGNWGLKMWKDLQVVEWIWVHNPTSVIQPYVIEYGVTPVLALPDLIERTFDKVIVSVSDYWLPPSLAERLTNLVKGITIDYRRFSEQHIGGVKNA